MLVKENFYYIFTQNFYFSKTIVNFCKRHSGLVTTHTVLAYQDINIE